MSFFFLAFLNDWEKKRIFVYKMFRFTCVSNGVVNKNTVVKNIHV